MRSEAEETEGMCLVRVAERLYSARHRERLRDGLATLVADGRIKRLVLDFSSARWFGAPILDELIVASRTLADRGAELCLVGSPKITRMVKAARADRVKLFANVRSALADIGHPACGAATSAVTAS